MVEKVWTPVPELNVPLFVMPPLKVIGEFAVLFQFPPLFIVTNPVYVLVPAALLCVSVPEMVVVLETAKLNPPTVNEDPDAILRFVHAAFAVIVTVLFPSINTTSPATGKLAPLVPPEVAAHVEVAFQFPDATEYRFAPYTCSETSEITMEINIVFEVLPSLIMFWKVAFS